MLLGKSCSPQVAEEGPPKIPPKDDKPLNKGIPENPVVAIPWAVPRVGTNAKTRTANSSIAPRFISIPSYTQKREPHAKRWGHRKLSYNPTPPDISFLTTKFALCQAIKAPKRPLSLGLQYSSLMGITLLNISVAPQDRIITRILGAAAARRGIADPPLDTHERHLATMVV